MEEKLKKSGVDVIGEVPYGTHFCLFYQTKEDLVDIIIPYFKAGLKNNELCIWITPELMEVEEAKSELRASIPNFDGYLEKGQIEIFSCAHWYLIEGIFD